MVLALADVRGPLPAGNDFAPVADVDRDGELAGEWVQTDIFALLASPQPNTTPVETVESLQD